MNCKCEYCAFYLGNNMCDRSELCVDNNRIEIIKDTTEKINNELLKKIDVAGKMEELNLIMEGMSEDVNIVDLFCPDALGLNSPDVCDEADYFSCVQCWREALGEYEHVDANNVIKPSHYKSGEFDVIAFCQKHDLGFEVGNIIKYVTRAGKKEGNSELQDLNKAMEYLKRRIEFVEGKK